jgi:hypothetical protein
MEINLSDQKFLSKVEDFTGCLLQKKEDIKKIIELVNYNSKKEDFENLIFTSKYISGLMRVLKNALSIPEVNNIENVRTDLNENIKKGIEQLKGIIQIGGKNEMDYFDKTYFSLTTQNLSNLSQLFADLELVKKYTNHLKRLM